MIGRVGVFFTFYDVPEQRIDSVRKIAGIPPSDDGLGSYPLDRGQVAAIGRVLETPIEQQDLDFFLEAYDKSANQSATA